MGFITYISGPHYTADLLHGVQIGTQPSVHCEDLFVDDGGDRQAVEAVGKCLPKFDVVSSFALVIEPVNAIDRCTLVIAAKDEEILGILDFVCKQQTDGLQRLLAAVDIISQEQVVSFRRKATVFEQAEQVVVLPMDVTTNLRTRFRS